jgi:hypothetical protein
MLRIYSVFSIVIIMNEGHADIGIGFHQLCFRKFNLLSESSLTNMFSW